MATHREQVLDLPGTFYLKLLVLALVGYFGPATVMHFWPDTSWPSQASEAHALSLERSKWADPWIPLEKDRFGTAWIACQSLEEALKLDEVIDDGKLHTGKLVLMEGGLAWRPE